MPEARKKLRFAGVDSSGSCPCPGLPFSPEPPFRLLHRSLIDIANGHNSQCPPLTLAQRMKQRSRTTDPRASCLLYRHPTEWASLELGSVAATRRGLAPDPETTRPSQSVLICKSQVRRLGFRRESFSCPDEERRTVRDAALGQIPALEPIHDATGTLQTQ